MLLRSSKRAFQLDQRGHLLAALGRFNQPIDDWRVAADAVERNFDRDDMRIVDRRIRKASTGRTVKRVMSDLIVVHLIPSEDRFGLAIAPHRPRHEWRVAEIGPWNGGQFARSARPRRASLRTTTGSVRLEILDQDVEHARRASATPPEGG